MGTDQNRQTRAAKSRVTMSAFLSALFFLGAGSGFYIIFDDLWGAPLKIALVLHPAIAILATWPVFSFTLQKAKAQQMPCPLRRLLVVPSLFAAAVLYLSYAPANEGSPIGQMLSGVSADRARAASHGFMWFGAIGTLLIATLCLRWAETDGEERRNSARRKYYFFTGGILWAVWLALLYTGIVHILSFQQTNIISTVTFHRRLSWLLMGLYLGHLYLVRPVIGPEERAATPVGLPARNGFLATLALLIAVAVGFSLVRDAKWRLPLKSVTLERRAEVDRTWEPSKPVSQSDLAYLETTASCGNVTGCHEVLMEEHLASAHNLSVQPEYFRKNLIDMEAEEGEHNHVVCGACHYPAGVVNGKPYRHYFENDNFSCAVCHVVNDVGEIPESGTKHLQIQPPWSHLKMFPPGDAQVSAADHLFVRLNAMGHRRAFKKPLHSEDRYCLSCHNQQIKIAKMQGLNTPKCIMCHMQPQKLYGGKTNLKSHLFPGASVAPALLTGHDKYAEIIRQWAEGKIVPTLLGWETLWNTRVEPEDKIESVPWVLLSFYYKIPPVPGGDFTLYIVTANTGLVHTFPAGDVALIKAWLEFKAYTEGGRLFCSQGVAAQDGPVPDDTPTLGGHFIGLDGKVVENNRVWQIKEKIIEGMIDNRKEITNTVDCKIPKDAGDEIRVEARWNYRKLNQDFLDYIYGKGQVSIPPIVAAHEEKTIPVVMEAPAYTKDPNYMVDPDKRKID